MSSTAPLQPSSSESHESRLPSINLLCRFETSSEAFQAAAEKYFPALHSATSLTIHNCSLARLPAAVRFDAIVSPANSYGFMDGAFDDAISLALSPNPRDGYGWTTRKVQAALYAKWRGYAPPGSCTLIDVRRDAAWHQIKRAERTDNSAPDESGEHKGGCKFIALCPTMRVPREVRWDREVVFECIWSLLCAVDAHNREALLQHGQDAQIRSILMTPLATGVGRVSEAKWAAQCVLALKYWLEAVQDPQKWSNLRWEDVYDGVSELLDATDGL